MIANCKSCSAAYKPDELSNGRCQYCRMDRVFIFAFMVIIIPILIGFGVMMLKTYGQGTANPA